MINVMLVCEYGISTSLMEDALKKEIKKRDIDMHIQAYSITDVSKYIDKMDYILLGPQVGFRKGELLKKYPNKESVMSVMNPEDFALLNTKKVLDDVLKNLNK